MIYVPPPIKKIIPVKRSFVHNQIANKTKSNYEHYEGILDPAILNSQKFVILKDLHEHVIEFKHLTGFKNELFDSDQLQDNHLLPKSEWERIRKYHT